MKKYIDKIHVIFTIICLVLILIGVVRLIFMYNNLPSQVGVHFAADGSFDVIVSKSKLLYIGYPYIVSLVIVLLFDLFIHISNKIRLGLKINKKGEYIVKSGFKLFVDIFKFSWVFFLSVIWSDCVIRQHYLNTNIPVIIMLIQFIIIIVFIIFVIVIRNKYSLKNG